MSSSPKRKSIRLKEYDYSQPGAYFVTICSKDHGNAFGTIAGTRFRLNQYGNIVAGCIVSLPNHFPWATMDTFVIMPNHIHCIIILEHDAPQVSDLLPSGSVLGRIVGYLKYQSSKQINSIHNTPGETIWQRNYYEHIIRNEEELRRVRQYIEDNPARWANDKYNPTRTQHGRLNGPV